MAAGDRWAAAAGGGRGDGCADHGDGRPAETGGALAWLADEGYDPVFGARPLKRVIQRHLQDPLAEMILSGDVLDGVTIPVTAGPEGLIIGDRISASRRERPAQAVVH